MTVNDLSVSAESVRTWQLPPINLLQSSPPARTGPADKVALERNARLLETVLSDFNIKGSIVNVRPGPVVTIYELEPAAGMKASRIVDCADDIARSMSAVSARVATIPGRNVIGIELPNALRETVGLRELIAALPDQPGALSLVLGKNIAGDPVLTDLAAMPHLLIAGTTGSGKSVGLNCMILSLLYRLKPEECRMIMIDPNILELSTYDGIPHLYAPVVNDPTKAVRALKWTVEQMEDRFRWMSAVGARSLPSFNGKASTRRNEGGQIRAEDSDYGQMPRIVVIIDELADIIDAVTEDGSPDELSELLCRLAEGGRAVGIHMILSSNRWAVEDLDSFTGAQSASHMAYRLASLAESEKFLGMTGAEKLGGAGDALYRAAGKGIVRVHGALVGDDEASAVADHWRAEGLPNYISSATVEPDSFAPSVEDSDDEQQYNAAIQLIVESQKASTSWLQRQLRIGYNAAARLIERMEKDGIVSRPDHVGRREVLFSRDGQRQAPAPLKRGWLSRLFG